MERVWVTLEIGKVMEAMLDELATWEWACKVRDLENRLHYCQAMVLALRKNEEQLIEANTRHRARALEEGSKAKKLQTVMCKDLWELAKKMDGKTNVMDEIRDQLCKKDLRNRQLELEVEKLRGGLDEMMMNDTKVARVEADEDDPTTAYGTPVSSTIIHRSSSVQQNTTTKTAEASGSSTGLMEDTEKATLLALSCSSLQTIFSYLISRDVIKTAITHPIIYGKTNQILGPGKELQQKRFSILESHTPPQNAEGLQLKERDERAARTPIIKLINSVFPKRGAEETQPGSSRGIMASTSSLSVSGSPFPPPSFSINSEVVNSLSVKLSFVEMRTIVNIAEHSKVLADENERLFAQKNDLENKVTFSHITPILWLFAPTLCHAPGTFCCFQLDNANAVKTAVAKQFLDTEAKLKQAQNECDDITRQSANDAEVIDFLDQRAQEMEQVAKDSIAKVC